MKVYISIKMIIRSHHRSTPVFVGKNYGRKLTSLLGYTFPS